MEDYKDVMLSEPPSRFTAAPAVQSMALDNYKGILLCDRPANAKAATQSGVQPFLPAGRSDERHVGMQPSVESRSRHELSRTMRQSSKISKPSAVTRHKRWLKSFATAVKQMQLDKAEDQLKADSKSSKLRSEQAELRRIRKDDDDEDYYEDGTPAAAAPSHNGYGGGGAIQEANDHYAQDSKPTPPSSLPPLTEGNVKKTSSTMTKKRFPAAAAGGKQPKAKPVWAMTEDEALDAEFDEHNALLNFASNLNYDKFIEDYEVKEALAIMRDRVKEIAAEQGIPLEDTVKHHDDDAASDVGSEVPSMVSTTTREIRRAREVERLRELAPVNSAQHDSEWNNSIKVGDKVRAAVGEEAMILAEKLLAQSESMKAVHTKSSLAKMLEDVTMGRELRTNFAQSRATAAANLTNLPPVAPPVVAQVSAESGPSQAQQPKRVLTQLRQSKDHVQNLPYMYRCPSL